MTRFETLHRAGARLDRLPGPGVVAGLGWLCQVGLVAVLLALAAASGDEGQLLGPVVLGVVVVLAGLATVPALILWWLDRYVRLGAVFAVLVGVGTLVVNEAHLTVWPYALALFLAGTRAWAGASLDLADLLAVDPGRFERVDATAVDSEAANGDSSAAEED